MLEQLPVQVSDHAMADEYEARGLSAMDIAKDTKLADEYTNSCRPCYGQAFDSSLLLQAAHVTLSCNRRAAEDADFAKFLSKLRMGTLDDDAFRFLCSRDCTMHDCSSSCPQSVSGTRGAMVLAGTNEEVRAMNDSCITELLGNGANSVMVATAKRHDAVCAVVDRDGEILRGLDINDPADMALIRGTALKLRKAGIPAHLPPLQLQLAQGLKVKMIRNVNPKVGLVNGQNGHIVQSVTDAVGTPKFISVKVARPGPGMPQVVYCKPQSFLMPCDPADAKADRVSGKQIRVIQHPATPAYASTYHCSQG